GPTAILPLNSLRDVQVGTVLEIWARGTATTPATLRFTVTVQSYDPTKNTVTLTAPLPTGVVLSPASTFVVLQGVAPETVHVPGPSARALYRGAGGHDLAAEIRPNDSPPVRLATHRYQRNKPIVTTFAGTGPNTVGANTFQLAGAEAAQLRVGDTFAFAGG